METGGDTTASDTFDVNGSVKPTDAQKVSEITAWLDAQGIDHSGVTVKSDLLALVK